MNDNASLALGNRSGLGGLPQRLVQDGVVEEAAMLTAQVADREPFGLQLPGCDNLAFARNLLRWLSVRDTMGGYRHVGR